MNELVFSLPPSSSSCTLSDTIFLVAFLMFLIDKDKRLNERLDYFLKVSFISVVNFLKFFFVLTFFFQQNISPHYESEQFLHHKLMEYEKRLTFQKLLFLFVPPNLTLVSLAFLQMTLLTKKHSRLIMPMK